MSTRLLEQTYELAVYPRRDIVLVSGKGARLYDEKGRQYIDCAANVGVSNIGHGHETVANAIYEQYRSLGNCYGMFYNPVRARLAEKLAKLAPSDLNRVFFCNSGAEAIEGALKFARSSTGRQEIIAAMRGFHGKTMGALAATWVLLPGTGLTWGSFGAGVLGLLSGSAIGLLTAGDYGLPLDGPSEQVILQENLKENAVGLLGEDSDAVKRQISQAIAQKQIHRDNLRKLQNAMEQAQFQLESTITALGTVYSQVKLLSARDVASGRAQRLQQEIVDQVQALQDVVETVGYAATVIEPAMASTNWITSVTTTPQNPASRA